MRLIRSSVEYSRNYSRRFVNASVFRDDENRMHPPKGLPTVPGRSCDGGVVQWCNGVEGYGRQDAAAVDSSTLPASWHRWLSEGRIGDRATLRRLSAQYTERDHVTM